MMMYIIIDSHWLFDRVAVYLSVIAAGASYMKAMHILFEIICFDTTKILGISEKHWNLDNFFPGFMFDNFPSYMYIIILCVYWIIIALKTNNQLRCRVRKPSHEGKFLRPVAQTGSLLEKKNMLLIYYLAGTFLDMLRGCIYEFIFCDT